MKLTRKPRCHDLTGMKFGILTVRNKHDKIGQDVRWMCICQCGSEKIVRARHLNSDAVRSCGCMTKGWISMSMKKHGMVGNRIYKIWGCMKSRCINKSHKSYPDYGGRGITICPEWMQFEIFFRDMGEAPLGMTLDRIDNNKGYCKENCRWATHAQQQQNKRNTVGSIELARKVKSLKGRNLRHSQIAAIVGCNLNFARNVIYNRNWINA